MSEQLLTVLKLCLLALLYLFFLRVLRAVWVEVNGPKRPERAPVPAAAMAATAAPAAARAGKAGREPRGGRRAAPSQFTVVEPADQRGRVYPLADEMTIGRAAGCQIPLDDTYASQLHARVFRRDGQVFVEDLGSTNGTFLNRKKITAAATVRRGDRVQVGGTTLELT